MAFSNIDLQKSWENPTDFPTYQDNETQVRADMQYLHTDMETQVNNKVVAQLNATTAAGNIGAKDKDNADSTVQAELNKRADKTAIEASVAEINAKIPSDASSSNKLTDKSYVDTQLGTKASASSVSAIEGKIPSVASSSNKLTDKAYVDNALATKANTSDVNTALATKANVSDVNAALATKANASDVTTALATKANASDVTTALATKANASDVTTIESKIPYEASSSNKLADKAFVNSSIATNTANYISNNGVPFTSLAQLQAYSGTVTNNDYAFVQGTDASGNTFYDRYKASVSGATVSWALEYRLNNSSFTAAQWAAITSGITGTLVTKLNGIEAGAEVNAIDGVKLNGTALNPDDDRKVNVIAVTSVNGNAPTSGNVTLTSADITDTLYGNVEDGLIALDGAVSLKASSSRVDSIEEKIPAEASSSNKLADKQYVGNNSVYGIQVNGQDIAKDSANKVSIPLSSYNRQTGVGEYGLVKGKESTGVYVGADGYLRIFPALQSHINARNGSVGKDNLLPITGENIDYAVKAAMCDGIGSAWTMADKLNALLRLGCTVDENGFVKFS